MVPEKLPNILRIDQEIIADLVTPTARVLDLGCGDGLLLEYLIKQKKASGFGVEISYEGVISCIQRGLPVFQGDIDQGLSDHQNHAFDFVILSHTLQTIQRPQFVMQEMLRVGKKIIVSFPNFGHWRIRMSLGFQGRTPTTQALPYPWHETPNIRMCTILDFEELCHDMHIHILRRIPISDAGQRLEGPITRLFANLLAPVAVFLLESRP